MRGMQNTPTGGMKKKAPGVLKTNSAGRLELEGYQHDEVERYVGDYYESQLLAYGSNPLVKANVGFTGYATAGVFNPIYGARMLTQMYKTDNAFVAIGSGVYDHEGVRITQQLAQKGRVGTGRDGRIGPSVRPIIDMIRQPYKELPLPFDYGLGLEALQGYDDTIQFQNYVDVMGANYGDALDFDILRPTNTVQPIDTISNPAGGGTGEEICLQNLGSIISSFDEIGVNGATANMVSPYGGATGDVGIHRSAGNSTYDSTFIDGAGGNIGIANFKEGWYKARRFWATGNSTTNKVWIATSVAQMIIDNERDNPATPGQGRYMMGTSEVYVSWDINGVSTIPGLDVGGISMRAIYGIPAIQDDNGIVDATSQQPDDGIVGEQFLIDTDVLTYDMLTPISLRSTDAFELTNWLQRKSVIMSRGEMRTRRFSGHAKLTNFVV